MTCRDELIAVYNNNRDQLIRTLNRLFPSLRAIDGEDLVQIAFLLGLKECDKPSFVLKTTWLTWLNAVARNLAITHLRRREADLLHESTPDGDLDCNSQAAPKEPQHQGLTPDQVFQQGERAERRRLLVSDLLSDYVRYVEAHSMHLQREIFSRTLRGQQPADIAAEMELKRRIVFDHRSRAFKWIREQVSQRDPHGSILATVFGPTAEPRGDSTVSPHRLVDVLRLAVDELGALCPAAARWAIYEANPSAEDLSDVRYHVRHSRWYLDHRPQEPGCRLCQAR